MPTFLEFFAGVGLARAGLGPGWQCLLANDFDPAKGSLYELNYGGDHLVVGDVADLDTAAIPPADMAWSSFPCQDLSRAGNMVGLLAEGSRSGAFWSFWAKLRDLYFSPAGRPPILAIENVVELLDPANFVPVATALDALNYRLGALTVDGRHFVPQSRPRVFVVAVDRRIDVTPWTVIEPTELPPWHRKQAIAAKAALPEALRDRWCWWHLPAAPEMAVSAADLIEPNDHVEADFWHPPATTEHLVAMMAPLHRARLDAMIAGEGRQVGFLYRRTRKGQQRAELRTDGLAGCLRTPKGGSSRQTVMIVDGPDREIRSRLITTGEAAALMGAPDHLLGDEYNRAYKAMGDAVVVPAVAHLEQHLLAPLAAAVAAMGDEVRVPPEDVEDVHGALAEANGAHQEWAGAAV